MPSSSTTHRASSGVRPCRSTLTAPSPCVTRQPQRPVEACIRSIGIDPNDVIDVADDMSDLGAVALSVRGRTFPGARVATPNLLGSDLSHHPSTYLCANEV